MGPGAGPPGGDGLGTAGGGRRARSPAATRIVTRPNLTECGSRGGVQRSLRPAPPGAPRARGGAAAREPSRRPRSSGRSPRRGRGAAARVLPAPAARGGAGPAGHQLLEEAEREREEPGGGGEEGGRRQEAADAAGSLHTALRLPWRVKAPPGAQRGGGRAGRERRPRGGPGRGAARAAAAVPG